MFCWRCRCRAADPNPASGTPSSFQMAAVLLTGNGVPWQLFNSVWGSIPFRHALPQQAAPTIVLLLFNRSLCSGNLPIRHAYLAVQRCLSRVASHLLAPVNALRAGRAQLRPFILAAPAVAREAVRAACLEATAAAAAAAAAATHPPGVSAADSGFRLCLTYQPVSQLLLGFVLPTYLIWNAELRSWQAFLAAHSGSSPANGAAGGSGLAAGQPGGHPEGSEVPLPGLVEYLMFALPAVLCMWSLVAVHA
ncbi:hypothetical protein ABPG75_012132 [Micractinium tetrahymenae]